VLSWNASLLSLFARYLGDVLDDKAGGNTEAQEERG